MKELKNIHFIALLIAGTLTLILLCSYGISSGEKEVCTKVQFILKETIIKDCHNRAEIGTHHHKSLGRKVKEIKITHPDGTKEIIQLEDSLEEEAANLQMYQFCLLEENPIQPDTLNVSFQKALHMGGIDTKGTGIIYRYKGKAQYSGNDSISMKSAFLLPPDTIDAKQLASVQGWVKYDLNSLIKHIPSTSVWGIVLCLIALTATAISWLMHGEHMKRKVLQKVEEEKRLLEIFQLEEKRQRELERLEAKRLKEMQRLEEEKQQEIRHLESKNQKEIQRLEEEKGKDIKRLEEKMQREMLRLEEENREEMERLEQEWKEEEETLKIEKEILIGEVVRMGNMVLYEKPHKLFVNGTPFAMPTKDFELLILLAKAPNHTLTSQEIEDALWGKREFSARNNLYNLIHKLKKEIEPIGYGILTDKNGCYHLEKI